MSPQGFSAWQKRQSIKGNAVKTQKALELRQQIKTCMDQCPDISQGDIAVMLGVRRETVNRHVKAIRGVTFPISDKVVS